jgi:hypothetical protein
LPFQFRKSPNILFHGLQILLWMPPPLHVFDVFVRRFHGSLMAPMIVIPKVQRTKGKGHQNNGHQAVPQNHFRRAQTGQFTPVAVS